MTGFVATRLKFVFPCYDTESIILKYMVPAKQLIKHSCAPSLGARYGKVDVKTADTEKTASDIPCLVPNDAHYFNSCTSVLRI